MNLKQMKYRTLIFDFDGTLADTRESIIQTMKFVAHSYNIQTVDEKLIESLIGLPLNATFEQAFLLDESLIRDATLLYRKHYDDIAIDTVSLFEGVNDTLFYFRDKGINLTVASSKGKASLTKILQKQNVYNIFSFVGGEEDATNKKPAPDIVYHIIDKFKCQANECLVVGDTIFDIEMGQRAKVDTCGVTYGNNTREKLERQGPNFIIDRFINLTEIVQ
jgi:phosphoglycolate phosphatase